MHSTVFLISTAPFLSSALRSQPELRLSNVWLPLLQVYAVALYVEAERAAKELGVRKRGGFFDDNRCALCHLRVPHKSIHLFLSSLQCGCAPLGSVAL